LHRSLETRSPRPLDPRPYYTGCRPVGTEDRLLVTHGRFLKVHGLGTTHAMRANFAASATTTILGRARVSIFCNQAPSWVGLAAKWCLAARAPCISCLRRWPQVRLGYSELRPAHRQP
jgi:hypothetical protein